MEKCKVVRLSENLKLIGEQDDEKKEMILYGSE